MARTDGESLIPNLQSAPLMVHLDTKDVQTLQPDALTPANIVVKAVSVGTTKATLAPRKAFLLACMAGLFIGLGASCMLVVKADSSLSFAVSQVLSGLVFSVGLFMVVTAGAELFTGNSLMLIGALEHAYSPFSLIRAWVIVYLGNLLGSLLLALLLAGADFVGLGGGAVGDAAIAIVSAKVSLSPTVIFFRAILCNALVCVAVWMSFAARTVIDKLAVCIMPVMAFVACGFEHCVANMFFIPLGMLAGAEIGLGALITQITFATIGNIVGGTLLVACIYWLVYLRKG